MPEHLRLRVKRGAFEVEVEGPVELVDTYYKEEIAAWASASSGSTRGESASTDSSRWEGGAPDGGAADGGAAGLRLKDFIGEKAPKGHPEIAVTLAHWARVHEGAAELNREGLEDLYRRAGLKRPADAANVMAKAASRGAWFKSIGEGKYELTATGEDHVIHDLPGIKQKT